MLILVGPEHLAVVDEEEAGHLEGVADDFGDAVAFDAGFEGAADALGSEDLPHRASPEAEALVDFPAGIANADGFGPVFFKKLVHVALVALVNEEGPRKLRRLACGADIRDRFLGKQSAKVT